MVDTLVVFQGKLYGGIVQHFPNLLQVMLEAGSLLMLVYFERHMSLGSEMNPWALIAWRARRLDSAGAIPVNERGR